MEGWGADWRLYARNVEGDQYFNAESVTYPSKNIVRVWEKWFFTEKSVKDQVKSYGEEYKTLSHQMVLSEFDCAEKKFRSLSSSSYSKDGGVLERVDFRDPKWVFIVPESTSDTLYKILCK